MHAPILLSPLLLVLAALPWWAPAAMDVPRCLVSLGCLLLSGVLAAASWPRAHSIRILCPPNQLMLGTHSLALTGEERWLLCAEQELDAPHTVYTARLVLQDGRRCVVLRNRDPGRVLWQLREVLAHYPRPVDCQWGLPAGVRPWTFEAQPDAGPPIAGATPAPAAQTLIRARFARKDLRSSLAVMTMVVLLDLGYLVRLAGARVTFVHPLSVVLPALFGGCLLTLAWGMISAHARLVISDPVMSEVSVLGFRWPRGTLRSGAVRGIYAIGADTAERGHLLFDSADGPLAWPVPASQARDLLQRAQLAITRVRTRR